MRSRGLTIDYRASMHGSKRRVSQSRQATRRARSAAAHRYSRGAPPIRVSTSTSAFGIAFRTGPRLPRSTSRPGTDRSDGREPPEPLDRVGDIASSQGVGGERRWHREQAVAESRADPVLRCRGERAPKEVTQVGRLVLVDVDADVIEFGHDGHPLAAPLQLVGEPTEAQSREQDACQERSETESKPTPLGFRRGVIERRGWHGALQPKY